MEGTTINGQIHFSPVMKRGGGWGWFETTANTRVSRFIAYGYVRTKRQAVEARAAAIARAED